MSPLLQAVPLFAKKRTWLWHTDFLRLLFFESGLIGLLSMSPASRLELTASTSDGEYADLRFGFRADAKSSFNDWIELAESKPNGMKPRPAAVMNVVATMASRAERALLNDTGVPVRDRS